MSAHDGVFAKSDDNPNVLVSADGNCKITFKGIAGLSVEIGDWCVDVDSEIVGFSRHIDGSIGQPSPGIIVWRDSLRTWRSRDGQVRRASDAGVAELARLLVAALATIGWEVYWDGE